MKKQMLVLTALGMAAGAHAQVTLLDEDWAGVTTPTTIDGLTPETGGDWFTLDNPGNDPATYADIFGGGKLFRDANHDTSPTGGNTRANVLFTRPVDLGVETVTISGTMRLDGDFAGQSFGIGFGDVEGGTNMTGDATRFDSSPWVQFLHNGAGSGDVRLRGGEGINGTNVLETDVLPMETEFSYDINWDTVTNTLSLDVDGSEVASTIISSSGAFDSEGLIININDSTLDATAGSIDGSSYIGPVTVTAIPESSSVVALLGVGALALTVLRRGR